MHGGNTLWFRFLKKAKTIISKQEREEKILMALWDNICYNVSK